MKNMSAKFKNIITGDIVDNDNIMDKIESGLISSQDINCYRTACCGSEVFYKTKSVKARGHFASIHKEHCPFIIKEYYIDSKGNEKYLNINKLPSVLNLTFFSIYDDDYNKEDNGDKGDSSKRSSKESDAIPRALYILEKIVGSSQSINIRLGDETISSNEVIDCRVISIKELTEKCNDKYIFAEVSKVGYLAESKNGVAAIIIKINTADKFINISLNSRIVLNSKPSHLDIDDKGAGKRYVFFKLSNHSKSSSSDNYSLRVHNFFQVPNDKNKQKYKILGATIYSK